MTSAHAIAPPVIRVTSHEDLLAAIPVLLGFHPTESLVGIALDSRRRVRLTARSDLGSPATPGDAVDAVLSGIVRSRPTRVVLAAYTAEPDHGRRAITELRRRAADMGWAVHACVLVTPTGWQEVPHGAVPDGGGQDQMQALPTRTSPVTAHAILHGQRVLPSREALAEVLAPDPARRSDGDPSSSAVPPRSVGEQPAQGEDPLAAAEDVLRGMARRVADLPIGGSPTRGGGPPPPEASEDVRQPAPAALDDTTAAPGGSSARAAALLAGLAQGEFRDRCYMHLVDGDPAAWLDAWVEVLRSTPEDGRPAPAGMVAMAAYLSGNGALARVAVDEALSREPRQPTALLVRDVLDNVVPPELVRAMLSDLAQEPEALA